MVVLKVFYVTVNWSAALCLLQHHTRDDISITLSVTLLSYSSFTQYLHFIFIFNEIPGNAALATNTSFYFFSDSTLTDFSLNLRPVQLQCTLNYTMGHVILIMCEAPLKVVSWN